MRQWWWSPRPVCCLRLIGQLARLFIQLKKDLCHKPMWPGEVTAPTQPFSTIPALADQSAITPEDAFGVAFFDKRSCKKQIKAARSGRIFTPPSLQGTLMNPGYAGGSNWGGVAVDAGRQIAVTNVIQIPALVRLIPRDQLATLRQSGALKGWRHSRAKRHTVLHGKKIFAFAHGSTLHQAAFRGKLVASGFEPQGRYFGSSR